MSDGTYTLDDVYQMHEVLNEVEQKALPGD